jgi:RimJ/RimL family protein N-acetyltransferase
MINNARDMTTTEEPPPPVLRDGARPPDRIEIDDLVVRRYVARDVTVLHQAIAASHEHLKPWMPWCAELPAIEEQADFLAQAEVGWASGETCNYGIFGAADGVLLGVIGLHARVGPGALEIGYWLHVDHTGKGVITRAAAAVTRALFAIDGIDRAEIHCDEANERSAAVPRRLGYRLDRIEDDAIEAPAETGRGMVWIMDRADFAGSPADLISRR